jgi:hypothetical protein
MQASFGSPQKKTTNFWHLLDTNILRGADSLNFFRVFNLAGFGRYLKTTYHLL